MPPPPPPNPAAVLFLLSLLLLSLPKPSLSLNQEGLYLLQVKSTLTDPTGILSDWNSGDNTPCNWTGITCTTTNVTAVNLPSAALSGPFPTFLCRLPSLSTLSLSDNSLNSTIPAAISACRRLTHLNLAANYFSGPIPATLADIPNLISVNIQDNSLSGEIPPNFGRFRRLETLILTNNLISGSFPVVFSNVSTLKELNLAYNNFLPGPIPPQLGNLTNIENLWLSSCSFVGTIPDSFSRLQKLSNLEVSYNSLSGPFPNVVFQIKNLYQLELFNNSFSGELPATNWSNLTALRLFDASVNNFTGIIPEELCRLQLESLGLADNSLEGSIPEILAQSVNLYDLRLFDNYLNGSLPNELGKKSPLQILDVSFNRLSGEIPATICEQGKLFDLILIGNSFSGELPVNLGECKSLERVRLSKNRFSGEVPAMIWGLPHVYLLDLADNLFSGNISSMISGGFNLSSIFIWRNGFSGSIPNEIGSLRNLIVFLASNNKFTGELPETLFELDHLGTLDLSENDISGEIRPNIESLKQLNELNLANNRLSGEIPNEICNLPGLNYLDLSGNSLQGKIPSGFENLKLNKLNLSNNRLTGEIPSSYAKEVYKDSFLGNPGLCGGFTNLCVGKNQDKSNRNLWLLRFIYAFAAIVLVVGVSWFIFKYRNIKKTKNRVPISKWRSFHKLGFSEFEIIHCLDEDNVIGSGASGKVYKVVLSNGETVAVKKLWESLTKDENFMKDEFDCEVETLGKIRHKNIVRLWCCCKDGNSKLLVYEYMPNGSLGDLIHSSKGRILDWPMRFKIVVDAAEGLSYLHHDCVPPIVHRDVKSNNILLDEDYGARISDFGVAKFVKGANKGQESMSVIAGSCGYIAPEYAYTLRVNEKSDIYSFGVVILELVTGRRPTDQEFGEKDLAMWVSTTVNQKGHDHVLDPELGLEFKDQIFRVLDIGLLCISPLPMNRPSMRAVVKLLQEAAALGQEHQLLDVNKDEKLSPYFEEDSSEKAILD